MPKLDPDRITGLRGVGILPDVFKGFKSKGKDSYKFHEVTEKENTSILNPETNLGQSKNFLHVERRLGSLTYSIFQTNLEKRSAWRGSTQSQPVALSNG